MGFNFDKRGYQNDKLFGLSKVILLPLTGLSEKQVEGGRGYQEFSFGKAEDVIRYMMDV